MPSTTRRRRWFLALVSIVLCVATWGFVIEPQLLVIHDEALTVPAWPGSLRGLRVLAISDLHLGGIHMSVSRLRRLVGRANEQHPDLIVLLGDFVSSTDPEARPSPEDLGQLLGELRAPLGVYAVLGNHDWWLDGERVRAGLERAGIPVLDGRVIPIAHRGARFWLAGLADQLTQDPSPEHVLDGASIPTDEPVIFITHGPDLFPRVPARVSLTLAGHTHGGQVRLPFLGPLIVPGQFGVRYAAGHIVEGGRHLFVTTGVGTSILPVRFGVPPEIALLRLQ